MEVDNNDDNFSAMESKTYNAVNSFLTTTLQNPIGNRNIKELEQAHEGYLIPTIYSDEYIKKVIGTWYQN